MSPFIKWPIAALTIIGSIVGVGITLFQIPFALLGQHTAGVVLLSYFLAAALYAAGLMFGILFAQNDTRRRFLQIYYALQLFWISAPYLGFRFLSGAHIMPGILGENLTFSWGFASVWHIGSSNTAPWGFGINLLALLVLWLLRRGRKSPRRK